MYSHKYIYRFPIYIENSFFRQYKPIALRHNAKRMPV